MFFKRDPPPYPTGLTLSPDHPVAGDKDGQRGQMIGLAYGPDRLGRRSYGNLPVTGVSP